ncbi:MAG TPA: hypothetical protein PKC18_19830, partial [Lacipirellulaceae bacterium]|nr:hypothetical protein [Lacipirellulaceae bacterium]
CRAGCPAGAFHDDRSGNGVSGPGVCDPHRLFLPGGAPPDEHGGRVLIDNPQVLANLSPGQLVAVQGQLFTRTTELGAPASFYRVSAVQRQRQ